MSWLVVLWFRPFVVSKMVGLGDSKVWEESAGSEENAFASCHSLFPFPFLSLELSQPSFMAKD